MSDTATSKKSTASEAAKPQAVEKRKHDSNDPAAAARKKRRIEMASKSALHKYLRETPLSQLLKEKTHKPVVQLDHNQTVGEALKVLADNRITSAPVVLAPSLEDNESGQLLGVVDGMSLLDGVLRHMDQHEGDKDKATDKDGNPKPRWMRLRELGAEALNMTLIQVSGHDMTALSTHTLDTDLLTVIKGGFLSTNNEEHAVTHRVAVFDDSGNVSNLITQSDLVRFVFKHIEKLGPLADSTLEDLGFAHGPVLCVNKKESAASAFHTMANTKVSSLGVVDENGALVGCVSSSDLRGMQPSDFQLLDSPVLEFLETEIAVRFARHAEARQLRVIGVAPGTKLRVCLQRLVETRLHRLFVMNAHKKPVGLLTLTDVLRMFVED